MDDDNRNEPPENAIGSDSLIPRLEHEMGGPYADGEDTDDESPGAGRIVDAGDDTDDADESTSARGARSS